MAAIHWTDDDAEYEQWIATPSPTKRTRTMYGVTDPAAHSGSPN